MDSSLCPISKWEEETICHALGSFAVASDVWAKSLSHVHKWWCQETNMFSLWADLTHRLDKSNLETVALILRWLWFRQNNFVFNQVFDDRQKLIHLAIQEGEEFQYA